jgi:hypothetical protein
MRSTRYFPSGLVALTIALLGCSGGAGAVAAPGMPVGAMQDAYDGALLGNTARVAPTFAEVASPQDEQSRRFRAWLGWTGPQCEPCPSGQDATCVPQCTAGKPFVCDRPCRMVACRQEETVSTQVDNGDAPVPAAGVYLFEGRWRAATPGEPAAFAVERISPMQLPEQEP